MKKFLILITLFLFFSCSSTKQVTVLEKTAPSIQFPTSFEEAEKWFETYHSSPLPF